MKKYPFVKQTGLKDCGPACIQMILKYFGGYMSLDKLSVLLSTNSRGTSAYNMVECLKYLGFEAKAYKFDQVLSDFSPCIAHVRLDSGNHYVVIYEIDLKKEYLIVADPSKRIIKYNFKDFYTCWTGIVICVRPVGLIVKEEEPKILKFITTLLKSNFLDIILICLLSILICFLSIISTFFIQIVISGKNFLLYSFIIILIFKSFLVYIKNKIFIKLNFKIDKVLLFDTFKKIIYLPYIYSKIKSSGELISYFNDLFMVKDLLNFIQLFLINVPLIIISSLILLYMCPRLFLFNLIVLLLYFINYLFFHKRKYYLSDELLKNKAYLNSFISESVCGYETINNINIHRTVLDRFNDRYCKYNYMCRKFENMRNRDFFIKDFIYNLSILMILIYGFTYKNNLITIYFLFSLLNSSFRDILDYDFNISNVASSIKHVEELKPVYKEIVDNGKNIKIKNLSKSFNNIVLKNINLSINYGEKIFVTGESGSGKSTLFKIIKGYYDYDGSCLVDGYESCMYNFKRIMYVSSNDVLFTGLLIDNLSLVKYNFINKKICEIDNFLDEDYIFENGFNLSTGQKQRIALARCLSCFDIIIIDEGLDGVDVNMERRIIKSLFKYYSDKTIIYISHRLDNLDLFDRFIKMDAGRIILDEKKV